MSASISTSLSRRCAASSANTNPDARGRCASPGVRTRKEANHVRDTPSFHRRRESRRRQRSFRPRVQPGHRRGHQAGAPRLRRRGARRHRGGGGGAAGLGGDPPGPPREGDVRLSRPPDPPHGRTGGALLVRAWKDPGRLQGLHHPGPGGGGVRLRHPATVEGRIQSERSLGRRRYLGAPARGRVRGRHAVQLPRHGAHVDVPGGDRLRQQLHPQAVGEGAVVQPAHGRTDAGGGSAPWRPQRGQRRRRGGGTPC